jgi:hypothetical protein
MTRVVRFSITAVLAVIVLGGCGYETSPADGGDALIVNRANGSVYRAYDSVVIELPRIDLESQDSGRALSRTTEIAGDRFSIRAGVKLLNTFLMWNLTIEPKLAGVDADQREARLADLMEELRGLRELTWTSVTLDLRDGFRFLVTPVEIALNDRNVTNVVDDEGETTGFMYEGQVDLGYEALRQIETLEVRWRL